ncbi:YggS family pyridoxal phosphate-dependent enzyme [Anaerosolibacter sp.]|uniref:YggS family pyridoxal phosphate-dependent enzyme n=1 Tax=Anaerosolibacter sp. TaxID=1872527 RepID=UPI0039F11D82
MAHIKENILHIQQEIEGLCNRIGKDPREIHLIAVTKTVDADKINEAIDNGIVNIGENKVQEIMNKFEQVDHVNWHMIGHLQTNKVKYIVDKVQMIHSVDRIHLAEEINKRAKQINRCIDILIQVNIAQEETKFGLDEKDIYDFIEQLEGLQHIHVKGLMTIAPYDDVPDRVRIHFKRMKQLFDEIHNKNIKGVEMHYLSMGMTNDFKVAIEEGANMIRIGTGIFGERNYTEK